MKYANNGVTDIKIAYVGGGSRGWAWKLMSDLASADDISGSVDLYDIDYEAAEHNEIIGNRFNDLKDAKSKWTYRARKTLGEALTGADFVIISILPGTFDEMHSDVHTPEKYGTQRKPLEYKTWHHPTISSILCRTPHLNNKQSKNANPIISRQDYHLTQPCPSEEKQTNKKIQHKSHLI